MQTGNPIVTRNIGHETTASYWIDRNAGIVHADIGGALTAEAIVDVRQAVQNDPDFDPSFAGLFDVSSVNKIVLTFATIRDAIKAPASSKKGAARIAIVVGTNLRLCRFADQLMKFWKKPLQGRVAFFPNVDEARRWLEL